MRRITIAVSAALMLPALAPAGALARHHHRSGRHHVRIERFGSDVRTAPGPSGSADNAGTVQSFRNGVLTIMLNDRSTVSGAVTRNTELECSGSGDNQTESSGDHSSGRDRGDAAEQQNEAEGAAEENETETENNCSAANLTSGTVVREAELRLSGSIRAWTKVELES